MCCNVPLGIALSSWVFVTAAELKSWRTEPLLRSHESSEWIYAVLQYHKQKINYKSWIQSIK